jgi:rhodanese-related sulfurtransferase
MVKEIEAKEAAALVAAGRILLVDVREAGEYDAERIDGALFFPLSAFDPDALPDSGGRTLVFQCRSGVRSAQAVAAARAAGLPHDTHLRGGILAWKEAGLPTVGG